MSFFKASEELKETVRKLYPEFDGAQDVKFVPTLEFGDATTDVPQRIGKQYHIAPSEVTKKIIAAANFPGECQGVRDFLNVTLRAVAKNWDERSAVFSACHDKLPEKIAIVLPRLLKTAPKDEYFRLAALSFLQLILAKKLGLNLVLYLGESKVAGSDSFSLKDLFKSLMDEILKPTSTEVEIVSALRAVIEDKTFDKVVLWLAPSSLSKTIFNQLYHSYIKDSERVELNCPERGYLSGTEGFFDEDFSSYTTRELTALILHLASPKQGLDLEITTAKFSERENLLWLMESLYQRKSQLKATVGSGALPEDLSKLTAREAELVRSAFFLDYFFRAGAYFGQVREFTEELQRFLMAFALYLSDPRLRMHWDEMSQETTDILSGAETVLSDTIAIWRNC